MKELIKIAWRNLWRNKRRTIITASSVFFAALIALIMRSFQLGFYNYTINSVIEHFVGHLQIQQTDYHNNPSIDNVLEYSSGIEQILNKDPEIKFYIPRLESGALVAHGTNSKVCMVVGIDPVKENQFSGVSKHIARYRIDNRSIEQMGFLPSGLRMLIKKAKGYYANKQKLSDVLTSLDKAFGQYIDQIASVSQFKGRYLRSGDREILMAGGLADFLGVSVGDSIVLLGQGYHGSTAIGKYRIAGILALPSPMMNRTFIYMPLRLAQELFSTYEINDRGDTTRYVSYIAVNTNYEASIRPADYKPIVRIQERLQSQLQDKDLKVLGWKQINKTLYQQIQSDNISGQIILLVIYIIIAFGVFGTVLMLMAERRKEFGIMLAIGMSRRRLKQVVALEILIMTLMGILAAIIVAYPLATYFHYHPIYLGNEAAKAYEQFNFEPYMPTQLPDIYFLIQPLVILVMMMLTSIYPIVYLSKLKVSKALRA